MRDLTAVSLTIIAVAFNGCSKPSETAAATSQSSSVTGADFGEFRYEPPAGWAKEKPSPGVSYGEGVVRFRPEGASDFDAPLLEIWEVTDGVIRTHRIAGLYSIMKERTVASRSLDAEQRGEASIALHTSPVEGVLSGSGEAEGFRFVTTQGETEECELIHWVKLPDGRRFRARYAAQEPAFSEHEEAIVASLATLSIERDADAMPPLTREEVVSALMEMLDDDRLWIDNGKIRGRVLNDRHMEALTDPAFARVTDFNVNPQSAQTDGVDVTDEGLKHLAHLPLKSLCLRGSLITDEGLAHLRDLPLKSLVIGETLVEGDGLRHLAGMNKLMVLDFAGTQVGDGAIEHLQGIPLAQLWCRNTRMTDAGLQRMCEISPDMHVVK